MAIFNFIQSNVIWLAKENLLYTRCLVCLSCELENIRLPPLHIELGFVKFLDKQGKQGFKCLRERFHIKYSQIKRKYIYWAEIRKVIRDSIFERKINQNKLVSWKQYVNIVKGFLGNKKEEKEENIKTLVEEVLRSFKIMRRRMLLKNHFLC